MDTNKIFQSLDEIVENVFGKDVEYFSPIFLTSKDKIEQILCNLDSQDNVFDDSIFSEYWITSITQAYRNGVYTTATQVLNNQYGKINSFERGEEAKREKQIEEYEIKFENLLNK